MLQPQPDQILAKGIAGTAVKFPAQIVFADMKETGVMDFGKLQVAATFQHPYLPMKGNGVALGVQISDEEYYLIGYQCALSLLAGDAKHVDILQFEEGCFVDGQWKRGRRLNGDETAALTIEAPKLFRLKVHTYNDYQ